MKKISRKAKNRKTHLPLLVQADSKETGGAVKFTEFNLNDFAKRLEQALLEQPNFQPPYTTTDMPACIVGYKVYPNLPPVGGFTLFMDILPGNEAYNYLRKQERHLPPLVSTSDIYEDKNGKPECEEFNIKEIGERLEYDLLQIPDFQLPHTTVGKPAHILSYGVHPVPDKRGVFKAFLEFLPGDKVPQYYEEILKKLRAVPESDNDTSAKRQKA